MRYFPSLSFLVLCMLLVTRAFSLLQSRICKTNLVKASRLHSVQEILSADNFDQIISSSPAEKLIVVDYSTTWCGPCKVAYPKFVEMSERYPNITFLKCVGDSSPELGVLMKREGVRSVPSFHFWKAGGKREVINGARMDEIEAALKSLELNKY